MATYKEVLDRAIDASVRRAVARKRADRRGGGLRKTGLVRTELSKAQHIAVARATIPARVDDGSAEQRLRAAQARDQHAASQRGMSVGVPDHGGSLAKARQDRAFETVANRVLDGEPRDRSELIAAIAKEYAMSPTMVMEWAENIRLAADRRRNKVTKGEAVANTDRFGNPIPATSGRNVNPSMLGRHIADRLHPQGSGAGPTPQHPAAPDFLHTEDLRRAKSRPFLPAWAR